MSIPHGLLALLDQRPMYGYQLRAEFERATGATWPLNIGQVYTTLTRLERDGQVVGQATDEEGRQRYEITAVGRETLRTWFTDPVTLGDRPRDELAIKLALAALSPGLDVQAVVQNQRVATMQRLQELTRLKRDAPTPSAEDLAWTLVLDNLRYMAEAELRWLDHCEGALARVRPPTAPPTSDPDPDAASDLATDPTQESLR
ncbi:PadR family transcriptional regulator [Nocardioides sp.]|jgi:DNA-binding PadR family transcriptional regulator|uniref:PadR family transcriptional regulator n=1 Tax=Nocardioides sp. TaxID=35761 RepID=UPI00260F98D7|nr:PadR family transcriptional regulator [Nocardioides sp.]